MSEETRTPRWAPETDLQWGLRHLDSHREKTTGTSGALTLTLLQLEQTTGLSGQRGKGPPDWAWFLPRFFSPFCHRWSFGSLSLSPLASLVGDTSFPSISPTWLHRYYLNWTELDDDITEFNTEMPLTEKWAFNLVMLHKWYTIFLFWYCAVALTQFVLLRALYK